MLDSLVGLLADLNALSDPLGWLVVGVFLAGVLVEYVDREAARYVHVVGWLLFGLFWAAMVYYFAVEQRSVIETVGSVVAIPVSGVVAYHLASGRDSLFVLSRAVAIMGLVFLPFVAVEALRRPLIESVTDQTAWLIDLIGVRTQVVEGMSVEGYRIADKVYPYESTFLFWQGDSPITYTIAIACTGIGSMAIFGGLIGAVDAPLGRKARALAVSIPVIYGLNLIRNVFIAVSLGEQVFHVFPGTVASLFSLDSPLLVSYVLADKVIAQSLSVVALVAITWLVVRELPEVLVVVEDALFVLTGREYDLADALGVDGPVR